jgi:hypothetical protein
MPKEKQKQLVDGIVEDAEVFAERTQGDVTRIMRVISMTRTARTLIARVTLQTKAALYALEVDEPTVRALVKVFDDFRSSGQTAPPPPPARSVANEGKPVED